MVNTDACTFLWLKLLIVELWVPAQCIFSICVMFSLPLWMASVYCELPLEDLFWDQISLTQWFLLALPLGTHSHIPFSAGQGVFFSTVGASSVAAVNLDNDGERITPNHRINFKQVKLSLMRPVSDHFCCSLAVVFGNLAPLGCRWW